MKSEETVGIKAVTGILQCWWICRNAGILGAGLSLLLVFAIRFPIFPPIGS